MQNIIKSMFMAFHNWDDRSKVLFQLNLQIQIIIIGNLKSNGYYLEIFLKQQINNFKQLAFTFSQNNEQPFQVIVLIVIKRFLHWGVE